MNLFFKELKFNRKSLIFWSIGMIVMVAAGMSKYSALDSTGNINDFLGTVPKSLQLVLGLGDFDLSKAIGFYGVVYLYLMILGSIHAAMLGANIIAKEERDKTTEFLFVKPITRSAAILYKLLAALFNIFVLNFVTLIISIIVLNSMGSNNNGDVLLLMIGLFLLQLLCLSLGSMMAAIMKKTKKAAALASGIVFVTFILSIMIDLGHHLNFLTILTPFKYFAAKDLLNSGLSVGYTLLSLLLTIVFTYATFYFYKKRDLSV